jgi:hypothetical protein
MEYYQNPTTEQVYGYNPENQQDLIDEAIANKWIDVTGSWPLGPTQEQLIEQLIEQCKAQAQSLLQATDWTTLSDITTSTPRLTNQSEFFTYRSTLRSLAVTPVANPTWPTQPKQIWA